ncbi:MAG: PEP-CTERM sorting domain-containing protein [Bryobacteraceae bacterium]|nr:PEP-CTERM sorting domain-containing protein [Bryobacteraceae bacterium]
MYISRVVFFLALVLSFSATAIAASITIPANLYGHMNQIGSGICDDGMGNNFACGPTATVNSFRMLDQKYGAGNGATLVPDGNNNGFDNADLAAVAGILDGLMGCTPCNGGTTVAGLIAGKNSYLNSVAPGKYYVHSQGSPTFSWFFDELTNGQDIEVLIGFYNVGGNRIGGHFLTVNGISGVDTNNNGFLGSNEANWSFIDPSGGVDGSTAIYEFNNLTLGALYNIGGMVVTTVIEYGIAESPVPEPGTVILLFSGIALLAVKRFRRTA